MLGRNMPLATRERLFKDGYEATRRALPVIAQGIFLGHAIDFDSS
jgi:hypothetical protein